MGLGAEHTVSLAQARQKAQEARFLLTQGIDPIDHREQLATAAKAEAAKLVTFKDAAGRYIAAHKTGWKNAKHGDQWESTLKSYAYPIIGNLSVGSIETAHVIEAIEPIWATKTETANRVRGRIELILDWATARGYRRGENPARWRGHLDKILPPRSKVSKVKHHAAMPYDDVATFIAELRAAPSISALALEFTILTATRTNETIGARRDGEVDFKTKLWTIPASRTKSGREHRIPLTSRAIEILRSVPELEGNPYLFPGARLDQSLSNMAMLELLRGMREDLTVHGFRSSFRDWAAERTNFPREIAEAALAHILKDKTEAAYLRGDALDKRRKLMEAWAAFCNRGPSSQNVRPFKAPAVA